MCTIPFYSVNYENAFWRYRGIPATTGTGLFFGDGATTFYSLSTALDVVGHELGHAITTFSSNLIYWPGPAGGLNEAFSDMAGTALY